MTKQIPAPGDSTPAKTILQKGGTGILLDKIEIIFYPLSGHKVTIEIMKADLYIATCNFNSIYYKAESPCKSYAVNEVLSFIKEDYSI